MLATWRCWPGDAGDDSRHLLKPGRCSNDVSGRVNIWGEVVAPAVIGSARGGGSLATMGGGEGLFSLSLTCSARG